MVVSFGTKRTFLFLQGLASPFFVRLAREIAGRGHAVHKINFCGGDRLFWPRLGAVDFRGRFSEWRGFLGTFLHESGVTDIVLFGDCRPYHRVALDVARARGITVHVFEEGYFRPDWITLERGGTNAFSSLPRDPKSVLVEAETERGSDTQPRLVSGGFSRRIVWEIANQIASMALSPAYPHYRRHRAQHPLREFGGWLARIAKRPFEQRYTESVCQYLAAPKCKYYLLPLQLESDYQIRRHSPLKSMTAVMETVMESFARKAPANSVLVVKLHPLDNGLVNFRKQAKRIARRLRLRNRVFVIDGGHLPTLLSKSQGVVLVNSTTGLSALHHGRSVKVLGRAVFDMPGLTFQGSLDRFWLEKSAPNQSLFRTFRRLVLRRAQVNGSFFTEAGIALAVTGAAERMGVTTMAGHVAAPSRAEIAVAKLGAAKSAVVLGQ
jgi:capsular polysaccharide export protein